MGSHERALTAKTPDLSGTLAHALHRSLCIDVLLSLRHTSVLAASDSVYVVLHVIDGIDFRNVEPSLRVSTLTTHMVTFRILLSC